MSVQEKLEAIPHRRIDLCGNDDDCHRPEIRVWAGSDEGGAHVTLSLMALWGQQTRFADLSPAQARKLAWMLNEMANTVDHVVNGVALDRVSLRQQLRECPENAERVP